MEHHDDLADAIAGFLGATPMTIGEIRDRLIADGHEVPEADRYGIDGAYRAVQLTPEFHLLDEHRTRGITLATDDHQPDPIDSREEEIDPIDRGRVVRSADVLAGVPFVVEVTHGAAARDRLVDGSLSLLVWTAIGERWPDDDALRAGEATSHEPIALVDPDGNHLGRATTTDVATGHGSTDAVVGPAGWLEPYAGGHVSLTIVDARRGHLTVRLAEAEAAATPTDAQQAAVLAAFDDCAGEEQIDVPGDPTTVRTISPDQLLIGAILVDRQAFTEVGVGSIVDVATAAGLEVSDRSHTIGAPGTAWGAINYRSQVDRLKFELDLDEEQAASTVLLFGCALAVDEQGRDGFAENGDELVGAVALMARSLDDPQVADAAWLLWAENDALPTRIDEFADHLAEVFDETKMAGVEWLRARLALEHRNAAEAESILRAAVDIEPVVGGPAPHAGVATLLAGIEADRGDAHAAQRLLDQVDDPYDDEDNPYLADHEASAPARIRREIAPYLVRPRVQVGRNERCPCGSGRKYKQCHLGSEMHPLTDRSGWLYAKATRFLLEREPDAVWDVADGIVGPDGSDEAAENIAATHLPFDLLLHEGGVFTDWFMQRAEFLPDDERQLAQVWAVQQRRLFEVNLSNRERLELTVYDSDERVLIEEWLPVEPLPTGMLVAARPLPVGGSARLLGGLCPVHPEYADLVVSSCEECDLEDVIDALGLTFDSL